MLREKGQRQRARAAGVVDKCKTEWQRDIRYAEVERKVLTKAVLHG